ncbi:chloroplastic import inner membrane translocase subunit HP30-2-like [Oryza glaberrima]|uniref:SAM domain-containing protein n=1 Tax=Oryza glaberrima TaxID=4538 RepID=I1P0V8_ORYGL|nr:chloroplastic import inner membrane translocase subunit HP30-2-like [Oryza glaberrima]
MAMASSSSASAAAARGGNLVEEWSGRVKALEAGFRKWMAEQPTHIEAAVTTAVGAVQGAALGGLMGTLTADGGSPFPTPPPPPNANPQAMASFKQAQALAGGPLVQARNFAVMTGANAGISCVMRRIRGGEDIQGSMAAAFGSGALFSIVSGMGTPNPVANAITTGAAFAIFQGGFFMIGQKFSKPQSEDLYYSRARSMLQKLGLEKYEKNFKKGLLTDQTLPLLTDSALRDVKIPPGPRLLILDQIKRDPEFGKAR